MTPEERAQKIYQWKVLMSHGDIGEAGVIHEELRKSHVQPKVEPKTDSEPEVDEDKLIVKPVAESPPESAVVKPIKRRRGGIAYPDGEFTINSLQESTGMSRAKITNLVKSGLIVGSIKVIRSVSHGRGRPERIMAKTE